MKNTLRRKRCETIDLIIVATTKKEEDKAIVELTKRCGKETFSGSKEDVLDRYYQAARKFNADIIVRITADCPLINPIIVDRVIKIKIEPNLMIRDFKRR